MFTPTPSLRSVLITKFQKLWCSLLGRTEPDRQHSVARPTRHIYEDIYDVFRAQGTTPSAVEQWAHHRGRRDVHIPGLFMLGDVAQDFPAEVSCASLCCGWITLLNASFCLQNVVQDSSLPVCISFLTWSAFLLLTFCYASQNGSASVFARVSTDSGYGDSEWSMGPPPLESMSSHETLSSMPALE